MIGLLVWIGGIKNSDVRAQDVTANGSTHVEGASQLQASFEHVRTVDYDPSAVISLEGCVNLQTMVSLGPDEAVETISVGDSTAWQIMPNRRGDRLFVKTMNETGLTNLTVVTNRHSYYFELRVAPVDTCSDGRIAYELRFRYPPTPAVR